MYRKSIQNQDTCGSSLLGSGAIWGWESWVLEAIVL